MASKKITVKYYLNKRAKAKFLAKEKYFPLYIQIIVNGKKAQIKSKINEHLRIYRSDVERITKGNEMMHELLMEGYVSEKFFEEIKRSKVFPLHQLLTDETVVVAKIIALHQPFTNEDFTLNEFSEEYAKYTEEITNRIDNKLKSLYLSELQSLLLKTIDREEKKEIYKMVDFLINYINWSNPFHTIYTITSDILPYEVRKIEDLLNPELRVQIKSFITFREKVNLLKRFFEKREMGKISTLSYLDWQTDIRDFVYKEFETLFGPQKALEYVLTLESLLKSDMKAIPDKKV